MEERVLGISEPSMYVPSALIGCGQSSRLLSLPRSNTGTTDITKKATQEKVVTICNKVSDRSEDLVTMDAESSLETNWTTLLVSTLTIIGRLLFLKKTAIIKLIIPPEELGLAREFILTEMIPLECSHRWAKPVTLHARNNEIFLILSNGHQLQLNSPEQVQYTCRLASIANVGEFIRIGMRLKSIAQCLNISRQNLKELTLLEPSTITPRKLLSRIRSLLSASWEELEVDSQYTDQVKKYGRTQDLLRMASPLIVLYYFWLAGRSNIVRLFLKLSHVKLVVIRQVSIEVCSYLFFSYTG